MNINFATLKSLTIPEGNVTKIEDVSGRVLWSAAPAFDGTIILRPSADISVDNTITLVPVDATAAYMLINEEVSDGASTYLDATATADGSVSGYAQFSLSGNVPNKITNVTNMYFAISADGSEGYTSSGSPIGHRLEIYLIINGTEYALYSATSYSHNNFSRALYNVRNFTKTADNKELFAVINEYLAENGTLPNIELRLGMFGYKYTDGKTKYGYVKVSQAYLVIECE